MVMIPVIQYTCGSYTVICSVGNLPETYSTLLNHAILYDDFSASAKDGTLLFVAVKKAITNWPEILITQRFSPGPEAGFHPGIMLIPENHLLLIGAGERLLGYDLRNTRRLWEDQADTGFWHWARHENLILMSAELELAAWDTFGKKLWTTFVEPPWNYEFSQGRIKLDVMGQESSFFAAVGPDSSQK
jgi:hypothetical protein